MSTVSRSASATPISASSAMVPATILLTTVVGVSSGSTSYVPGSSHPSAFPLASAGRPMASASSRARCTSSSDTPMMSAIFAFTCQIVVPGITVIVLSVRFVSSRRAASASAALICSRIE